MRDKKKIVFHIGASKAGSSAIQVVLGQNSDKLRDRGVLIPSKTLVYDSEISGEQIWYFENLLLKGNLNFPDFFASCDEWFEINKDAHTIIFSAENLSNNYVDGSKFLPLKEKYEIEVIFYIRRQDDYFASAWQQWFCKTNPDFWAWCIEQLPNRANWQKTIESWEQLVGEQKLIVRLFERDKLINEDIVDDFLNILGLSDFEYTKVKRKINPSYNLGTQDLVHTVRRSLDGIHDNSVYEMIGRLTAERHHKVVTDNMLSQAQRLAILSHYSTSNEWIKNRYFANMENKDLFTKVRPQAATSNSEIRNQKDALMFDLIHQIYIKVK